MLLQKTLLLSLLFLHAPQTADGWLGVYLRDTERAEVAEVSPGSPAANAGLRAGDRFLAVDDVRTDTREAFVLAIRAAGAGAEVKLRIRRGGRERTVTATLAKRPADVERPEPVQEPAEAERPAQPGQEPGLATTGRAFLGLTLQLTREGLVVYGVVEDGPCAKAGVRIGERLARCGDKMVVTHDDVEQVLAERRPGDKLALNLRSEAGSRSVLVELGVFPGTERPAPDPAVPPPPKKASPDKAPPRAARTPELGDDLAAARRRSKEEGKPILLVFAASWNSACQAQRKALSDPNLAPQLEALVPVWLDTDRQGELAEKHGVQELPDLRILQGEDTVWRHVGYLPAPELIRILGEHSSSEQTEPAADRRLEDALRRVGQRIDRVERRLGSLEQAAQELSGLAELRAELDRIRKLLVELRGK